MSADDRNSPFEQSSQALLGESVTRVSGRVRSRLNQARHAALAEIETARPRPFWRMPATSTQSWQAGHQYVTRSPVSSRRMRVPQRRQFSPARP